MTQEPCFAALVAPCLALWLGCAPVTPAATSAAPTDSEQSAPTTSAPPAAQPAPSAATTAPTAPTAEAARSGPVLLREVTGVHLVCADPTGVAYATAHSLLRLPWGSAEPVGLAAATRVTHAVSDGATLYYSLYDDGSVRAVPLKGGKEQVLFSKPGVIGDLELYQNYAYFTWNPSPDSPTQRARGASSVMRVPALGGAAATVAGGLTGAGPLAVGDGEIVVAEYSTTTALEYDLESNHMLPAETSTFRVRQKRETGAWRTLASGSGEVEGVSRDAEHLYWWHGSTLAVYVRSDGRTDQHRVKVLASDADHLYTHEQGALWQRKKPFGEPRQLAPETGNVTAFSAGSKQLYWISEVKRRWRLFALDKPDDEHGHD